MTGYHSYPAGGPLEPDDQGGASRAPASAEPEPLPPWATRTIIGVFVAAAAGCVVMTDGWLRTLGIALVVIFGCMAIMPPLRRPRNRR